MKEKIKTVYYCEHCKKHGLSKPKMQYHERICSSNPENNRPCFQCEHLTYNKYDLYDDNPYGGQWVRSVNLLFCDKKKMFLYTPKNEIKGNHYDLGEESNNPMPKICNECTLLKKPNETVLASENDLDFFNQWC
jgi:hypothetical protein